jgi:hypothetical protein
MDPIPENLLIIGAIVILCGLAALFFLAVIGYFVYRNYSKRKKAKKRPANRRPAQQPKRPQVDAPTPTIPNTEADGEEGLISFDDAIELSLEIIKSSDLDQATSYLGQELKQEDLNTIWIIADLIRDFLVQEGFSTEDADVLVKKYKSRLRNLPKMVEVFSEFPTAEREILQMGDLIDDLLVSYIEVMEFPEGDEFLDKNPILLTMFADMRITTLALQQFLEANQSPYWAIKNKIVVRRASKAPDAE